MQEIPETLEPTVQILFKYDDGELHQVEYS